jgi:branched-chain amino acid transport system substrate-binding protein
VRDTEEAFMQYPRLNAVWMTAALSLPLAQSTIARAEDTVVFGAAISLTGKTAKEGEYTRVGYQFAFDTLNQNGGITIGGKKYKAVLKFYDDE